MSTPTTASSRTQHSPGPHASNSQVGAALPFNPQEFIANSMPDGLLDSDVRSLIQGHFETKYPDQYTYIVGVTKDDAIYSMYKDGKRSTYQCSYSINTDTKEVTCGDPQEVVLTTAITPVTTNTEVSTNQAAEPSGTHQTENSMTTPATPGTPATSVPVVNSTAPAPTPTTPATTPAPVTEPTTPAPVTAAAAAAPSITPEMIRAAMSGMTPEQFLQIAPPSIRDSFESGMRMHSAHKGGLIQKLTATGRCKFNEQQLNSFDVPMLENLVELARVPDFSGQAPAGSGVRANQNQVADGDLAYAPSPPSLFVVNNGAAAPTPAQTTQAA
jgi:hypothetical protein